ncbi:hypothetical protein GIB67_012134 [Kingdonia uniflora]|uniref:Uncharacterized protein n=1 Tax=Kingdonia uniflora TaxID=39325 RepID=A0A7J7N9D2_9MAGN|nr:hypothetical protein GIB67_012134 [Kingdonia uniflora]
MHTYTPRLPLTLIRTQCVCIKVDNNKKVKWIILHRDTITPSLPIRLPLKPIKLLLDNPFVAAETLQSFTYPL